MTRTFRRWTTRLAGGALALAGVGLAGCKQPLLVEPADFAEARRADIPRPLEERPHDPVMPGSAAVGPTPATVTDLKRELRPLTLNEAVAIAAEQGNVGSGGGSVGTGQDTLALPQSTGRGISGSDTVRAFVLDPAVAAAEVERSLSKFDARWITSMTWGKTDQATLNLQQSFSNGDSANFSSTLAKPLPTGGVAAITASTSYQNLSSPPPASSGFVSLNTSYSPRVQFIFEQPLLRGFGVEANQLLNGHPGSVLISGFQPTGSGTEPILIARVRTEQARQQFDALLNSQLLSVELAYWNLYSAYYNLYAQEEGLKQSFASYQYYKVRVEGKLDQPVLLPQSEAQYWQFYNQVVDARGQVLEADRTLRGLLGMRSDDGTVFKPVDEPKLAEFKADVADAYREGLQARPEVLIAREELKAQQLNLRGQKILRQVDLRSFASYDITGLGNSFGSANANLADNRFNSYNFGLRMDIPLGFREANALVRQAQLALWRTWYQLQDAERKTFEGVVQADRQAVQAMQQIRANRARRLALQRQVELIGKRIEAEVFTGDQYITLLDAQRNLADATASEFRFIAQYNQALARLEYSKGTIQQYNRVTVADGPLPAFVQKKAADHFRERQVGLKVREHPADLPLAGLNGFNLAPVDQMTNQMLQGGQPAAGQPGLSQPGMGQPGMGQPGMGQPGTGGGMPPAGAGRSAQALPGFIQPPSAGPAAQPAPSTVRSWDTWQPAPSGPATSTPSALPIVAPKTTPTADPAAGTPLPTFQATGTLNLPQRRPFAPATVPALEPMK